MRIIVDGSFDVSHWAAPPFTSKYFQDLPHGIFLAFFRFRVDLYFYCCLWDGDSMTSRVIGFLASLILTLTAFLIIIRPDFFHLGTKGAIYAILILAILQSIIQSIFFLNILSEKGTHWNLVVFASTISIIL